ncbi:MULTISPECIES: group II truncated hemoglobin [unclassified Crossiella]|uniref:group II truncated hemoglobin n=1 Tax=unclassified Crossiella TaxID=2620835 RepID=UPI001FFE4354|nr:MULTISPECIES: antibiotic biosynthesis monooxygenase [unclassified Crossiella]MCK2241821.1 antibiotic biosynthesis monooxygenase [Crossiella sp. S99.2]MCK2255724.1 antibiotic biosynthesis monooxygenase [Crossiella sp. S99.1]
MIVEYLRYTIPPAAAADFEAAYARAATALAGAPECVDYDLSRCVEDPSKYVLRIRWTSAQAHLGGFRQGPYFPPFFAEIRGYVGDIEEMRHYEPTPVAGQGGARPPTLYDWAGGHSALLRLTEVFYRQVAQDPVLAPVFREMDPRHAQHVATWLGEVLGGPADYSAGHGGHPHMIAGDLLGQGRPCFRHLGRGITEAQRRRWVTLLQDAADEAGLPADPEFRAAFAGYLEWGSRLAVLFSAPGATPNAHEPVPHWDWIKPPWQPSA